jgi:hypothetical protein
MFHCFNIIYLTQLIQSIDRTRTQFDHAEKEHEKSTDDLNQFVSRLDNVYRHIAPWNHRVGCISNNILHTDIVDIDD